jgi:HAD superfamily hydrolase (TIGR01509 family)
VVGGDDVTRHKPAPEPYLLAASRLGACAPLVVEDSEAGIASGRAAGFEVLPVRSPAELPDLLRQVALGGADPLVRAGRPRPARLPQNQVLAADEKPARGPGAFDAILFDFDGVLLDSEPVHCECWAAVLHPLGVRLTWEVYRDRFVGVVAREMLRVLAAESDPPLDWMELRALYPAKRELFQRRMTANPAFHPALDGLLTALHARYKLAVVSSSGCPEIEPVLEAGKLRHHFDTVVGGGDVRQPKPAPEPYLLAASRLGARAPLVVEDSEAGIASARAAGFEVLCVRGPAEVPDLLRRVVLCT